MNFRYFFFEIWAWFIHTGIPLIALLILGLLIPRLARLATRIVTRRLSEGEESTKATLALVGALVYVLQIVAYFLIILVALTILGVPPMGAAVPATVVSAAIGFGAQNVIGDFLAGFFIISERQFGVGDFVSFDGTSNSIEGTVVALTLRSTKVRTPAGELVTVPNGSAGVITNFSQDWSRAVVDIDLPLLPGESMKDLTTRVEKAAQDAIQDPNIADNVIGELEVLPAMNVTQPAVAGQAWSVSFRAMVQVEPAMQWAVARVIRARLINAFWDRYDSPSMDARQAVESLESSGQIRPAQPGGAAQDTPDAPAADRELTFADAVSGDDLAMHQVRNSASSSSASDDENSGRETRLLEEVTQADAVHTGSAKKITSNDLEDNPEATAEDYGKVCYEERWKNALTLGGRFRASTTALVTALVVLGSVSVLAATPEDGQPGVLSPDRWRESSSSQTSTSEKPAESTAITETTEPVAVTEDPNAGAAQTVEPQDTDANGVGTAENSDTSTDGSQTGSAGSTGSTDTANSNTGNSNGAQSQQGTQGSGTGADSGSNANQNSTSGSGTSNGDTSSGAAGSNASATGGVGGNG